MNRLQSVPYAAKELARMLYWFNALEHLSSDNIAVMNATIALMMLALLLNQGTTFVRPANII